MLLLLKGFSGALSNDVDKSMSDMLLSVLFLPWGASFVFEDVWISVCVMFVGAVYNFGQ